MPRQFVIQLPNRPGELAHIARALAARWIDIEHVASAGHGATSCAFLTTSDPPATRDVLRGLGLPFVEGDMIVVDIDDVPGGLACVTEKLAAAGVNIVGTLMVCRHDDKVQMAFAVDDEPRAREALGLCTPALAGL
ncbi:MAG TPA: hypothetical protein VIV06_07285, partial [Candidatus Limnocylindrales bacterium]